MMPCPVCGDDLAKDRGGVRLDQWFAVRCACGALRVSGDSERSCMWTLQLSRDVGLQAETDGRSPGDVVGLLTIGDWEARPAPSNLRHVSFGTSRDAVPAGDFERAFDVALVMAS